MQSASAVARLIKYSPYLTSLARTEIENDKYLVRFARSRQEVDEALRLRFEVFNLELNEGLDASYQTGYDRDEFDDSCHHLIVIEKITGKIIGTYRLRTIEMAGSAEGFYSSAEFDLTYLPPEVLNQSVELGRACIAREHRDRQVLFLLWKRLAQYVLTNRKRFLFGCCSLTSQEPREGKQLFGQLAASGHIHPTISVPPKAGYECIFEGSDAAWSGEVKLPKLFRTYLGIGAKVCSPPVLDRRFKTIDYFVVFDIREMDARTQRMFFS